MRLKRDNMAGASAGFTLAEMAMVILIVGLLLGSVLTTVSSQLDARNLRDMQTQMDQIKDALIGYAQANGRLPCPASGTVASGTTGAGLEQYTSPNCTSTNNFGVLPWATLGVAETDVWGRRLGYKVSTVFVDAISQGTWTRLVMSGQAAQSPACVPVPTPTLATFALCSYGDMRVTTRTSSNKTGTNVDNLPVVIISYGKNGYGAYTPAGTQITAPPAANADETANATTIAGSGSTAWIAYSREISPQTSTCSDTAASTPFCEFDDVIAYIPSNILVTRAVSAGKLP